MTAVFLSYARGDDAEPFDPATSFVARLHHDLEGAGFDVWFDRGDMPSRSLTFHQEIRDAIAARDRLLLVVGPKAVASDYVRQEWLFAWREADKVVTPILRLGDYPIVPDELKLLHCEDFRDDAQYPFHLENLIRQLRAPAPPLGKLIAVPSLPPHYLQRTERLGVLRDALRADLDRPIVIGGAAAKVGVHGMGGIGKSVLASAVAHDRKVREAFPDGIVWVGLGSLPDVPAIMRRAHRDLGSDGIFETEHQGKVELKKLLAGKAVLLILDDVWRRADVDWFDVLGSRCRALVTTRDTGWLTSLGGVHHVVELLTDQEAKSVLALAAGVTPDELPSEAAQIIAECGRLPLAVALCGAMIRRGLAWDSVLVQLQQARIDRIADRHAVEPHHQSVWNAIHVSVEFLPAEERERFLELAVFPPDETTPEAAIVTLWAHTGKLDSWETQELLVTLEERSLVQRITQPVSGQSPRRDALLHDLVYDYVRRAVPDVKVLQDQLLATYRAKCKDGWPSGPNDGYYFTHLRWHMIAAGRASELADLLHELHWLEVKNEAGLTFDLTADFRTALDALPGGDSRSKILHLLDEALGRDAQFIARHFQDYPQALFQCLWNRCWWYDAPDAAAHYDPPPGGWPPEGPPWSHPRQDRLATRMDRWLQAKETRIPGFVWLRSLRPPQFPLGGAEIACFWGHHQLVSSVAFSSDSKLIVSAGADSIWIWDARTGAARIRIEPSAWDFSRVAFSPDSRRVVSVSHDGTVQVWDARSGAEVASLAENSSKWLAGWVAWSSDGRRIASDSGGGIVRVWDADSGSEVVRLDVLGDGTDSLDVLSGGPRPLAWAPDSRRLASASGDWSVRIWDTETGIEQARLRGHETKVSCLGFSPDGRQLASGFCDRSVRIWDVETGAELACLRTNSSALSWAPDGRRIATASDDAVLVWDVSTSSLVASFRGHTNLVYSVSWSADGRRIASGSSDETVRVWDARTTSELPVLREHTDWVEESHFISDGTCLVTSSMDQTVRVWDAFTGLELARLNCKDVPTRVSSSPDGRRVVVETGDRTVRVWDRQTGAVLTCKRVVFTEDGRLFATMSRDGVIHVWDGPTGGELVCLSEHDRGTGRLMFSPDGRLLASQPDLGALRIWNARTGEELACLRGNEFDFQTIAFAPDGRRLATASATSIRIWDIPTGQQIALCGSEGSLRCLAWSPDGQRLACGCRDRTIRIWDTASGTERNLLRGHDGAVIGLAFSADGRRLASRAAPFDRPGVWDVNSGECLGVEPYWRDLEAIANGADVRAWHASGGYEIAIKFWGEDDPIAWFAAGLFRTSTHHGGRLLAGAERETNHLYMLHLEGDPHRGPAASVFGELALGGDARPAQGGGEIR